ncbi:MAG: universal stress protein [Paracoccaceae bacterium]
MAYKSLVTIVTDAKADESAIEAARIVAQANSGHLDLFCMGLDRTQPGFYYAGTSAMIIQSNMDQARSDADALKVQISERFQGADITWSAVPMAAQMIGLTPFLAHQTRFADLVVLPRPYGPARGHEHEQILELALFNAHVPVLVIPDGAQMNAKPKRIVVGWNEGVEALAAVRAALPLLQQADVVDIVVIDPPQHGPDRSDPGGGLSAMLARHGVNCEVSVLAKTLPRTSDTLLRHARDRDADMIVMGAYGHSRFRESILGGATRNMLEMAELPVLMAH